MDTPLRTNDYFVVRVTFNNGAQALLNENGGFTCSRGAAGEWPTHAMAHMAARFAVALNSDVIGAEVAQLGVDGSIPPHQYPYAEVAA